MSYDGGQNIVNACKRDFTSGHGDLIKIVVLCIFFLRLRMEDWEWYHGSLAVSSWYS